MVRRQIGDRQGRAFNWCRRKVEFTAYGRPDVETRVLVVRFVIDWGDGDTRIGLVSAAAVVFVGRPMV